MRVRQINQVIEEHSRRALPLEAVESVALRDLHELLEMQAQRIAHALHDEAGQLLTAVHLKLAETARCAPRSCGPRFEEIGRLLEGIEMHLRRFSHELRPPVLEDFGLVAALEFLIQGVSGRTGIPVLFCADAERRYSLVVETTVYRVVQEALTNMSRHSGATRASVELQLSGSTVSCIVQDNGCGFDLAAGGSGGLGLRGIRRRVEALGGRLSIRSSPGHGTRLEVAIPAE